MLSFKSAPVLALTKSVHGGRVQTKYHQRFCYLAFSITPWALPCICGGWQPRGFHLRIRHRTWNILYNVWIWIEVFFQFLLSCVIDGFQPCPPPCPVSPLIAFLSLSLCCLLSFFPPLHLIKALQKLLFFFFLGLFLVVFLHVSYMCNDLEGYLCFCCCFTVGDSCTALSCLQFSFWTSL